MVFVVYCGRFVDVVLVVVFYRSLDYKLYSNMVFF